MISDNTLQDRLQARVIRRSQLENKLLRITLIVSMAFSVLATITINIMGG